MDSLYRYTLSDMEGFVRQYLSATDVILDANGNQVSSNIVIQNISNQEIDARINESLVALYSEAILANETLFATDIYQDITPNVQQYALPQNMLIFRYMKWRRPGSPLPNVNQPPNSSPSGVNIEEQYWPMIEVEDPMDKSLTRGYFSSPTYRRNMDNYILSWNPQESNPQGILINACLLPPPLTVTTTTVPSQAVIQGMFARLAQEVVCYEATIKLASMRKLMVSPIINQLWESWKTRYFAAILNAVKSPSTNLMSTRLMAKTYSNRRTGAWNMGGWNSGW